MKDNGTMLIKFLNTTFNCCKDEIGRSLYIKRSVTQIRLYQLRQRKAVVKKDQYTENRAKLCFLFSLTYFPREFFEKPTPLCHQM